MSTSRALSSQPNYGEWFQFFVDAGLSTDISATYADTFLENRIKKDMLKELDREYLNLMNVTVIGDVIAILRQAKRIAVEKTKELNEDKEDSPNKISVTSVAVSTVSASKANDISTESSHVVRPVKRKLKVVDRNDVPVRRSVAPSTKQPPGKVRCVVGPLQVTQPQEQQPQPQEPPRKRSVFSRLGEDTDDVQPIAPSTSFTITNNYESGGVLNRFEKKSSKSETVFSRLGGKAKPAGSIVLALNSESDLNETYSDEDVQDEEQSEPDDVDEEEDFETNVTEYIRPLVYTNPQRMASQLPYQGILKKSNTKPKITNRPKQSNTMRADVEERLGQPGTSRFPKSTLIKKKVISKRPVCSPAPVATDGILGNSVRGMKNTVKQRLGGTSSIVLNSRPDRMPQMMHNKSVGPSRSIRMRNPKTPIVFDIQDGDEDGVGDSNINVNSYKGVSRNNFNGNIGTANGKRVHFDLEQSNHYEVLNSKPFRSNKAVGSFVLNTRKPVFNRLGE